MKANLAVGIVFILCGYNLNVFAQLTAYANVYAEVVEMGGIEQTTALTSGDFTPTNNSVNVILVAHRGSLAQNIPSNLSGIEALALFRINGGSLTTFFMTLTEGSKTDNYRQSNLSGSKRIYEINQQFCSLSNNPGIRKAGSNIIIPVDQNNFDFTEQGSIHVTLNYN